MGTMRPILSVRSSAEINSKSGIPIASKVDEPLHESVRKEMDRGRLLFYVTFKGGTAYLDIENLRTILEIENSDPSQTNF